MIKFLIGDLFESKMQTLVNTVNCVGVMGKGVAFEFKKRFPEMYRDYTIRCKAKQVKPGIPYLYSDLFGTSILNFPTKDHWRSGSRLDDIVRGLDLFVENYRSWGITSIAFPPLGCGNGGLEWHSVGPVMYQKLMQLDIPVEIYAPFGTPKQQLAEAFLNRPENLEKEVQGRTRGKLIPEWVSLLEVLYQLEKQPYASTVGRTIFQKICYTMTEQGIQTGFHFKQGSYGPFAPEVKEALNVFANANLILEEQLGRMTALKTGSEYPVLREKYKDSLVPFRRKIDKTVDLFARIKNTEQAEEVTTVFYAARTLKAQGNGQKLTENDVFNYVLRWKSHWDSELKKLAIATSIRNLVMLNWIKVDISESLPIGEDAI